MADAQKRLTTEMEGVFRWFQIEVLQAMQKNVKLDEEYIAGSRRVYEVEVRKQANALEKELRRGAYRDSLENSEYMQFLRQSQQDILKEEERRYRFVTEKHCALTQSLLFFMMKTGSALHQKADGWKQKVNDSKNSRPKTPIIVDQEAQLQSSVSSLLQTVARDEDMSWAKREQQALGRVPSRAPSPVPTRGRSSSVGESLGLASGRIMRAVVSHPSSSNPKLLPFNKGELIVVLVEEPRNGWLYGRTNSSLGQGWFPAAYVTSDDLSILNSPTARSHSMNNLLEPSDASANNTRSQSPEERLQDPPASADTEPTPSKISSKTLSAPTAQHLQPVSPEPCKKSETMPETQ
uniref:Brain-specific angiogenesis inhibitor 1-associated protein 2-like protein 2 n=1 Tax=Knipowitschia caucasica TaxID=637954 RepID=A0AAV2LK57_KNICA